MTVLGIDVSIWQDDNSTAQMMNFAQAKAAGAKFVFIKASQGGLLDPDYVNNWLHAEQELPRGPYHFYDWRVDYQLQLNLFRRIVENDPGEMPPVLDYEMKTAAPHPSLASAIALRFLRDLEQGIGKTPLLYTSPGYWGEFGRNLPAFAHYPLWIAHYGAWRPRIPRPWTNWTFWQFSSKGDGLKFGAESKSLDMNYFNGSEEELRAWCGDTSPQPSPEGEGVKEVTVTAALGLRVREAPNTSSRVLKTLRYGSKVRVEGNHEGYPNGDWLKLADEPGWISSAWVKVK